MEQEGKWYKALVPSAHVGSGRSVEKRIFLHATSMVSAMHILTLSTRGWKKTRGALKIEECSEQEVEEILEKIKRSNRVSMDQVLAQGFFYEEKKTIK